VQQVSGVVLERNQLRRFRWWPAFNHFELGGVLLRIDPSA
jgi:hypothetical protein